MVEFLRNEVRRKVNELSEGQGVEPSLESLMIELLREESQQCATEKPPDTGGEMSHSDGGCDCWTYPARQTSEWLGQHEICWQFKAQKNFSPSFLKKEIGKKYPQQALTNGGYYFFVASKKGGRQQKDRIRDCLTSACPQHKERIVVFGSEDIVEFCLKHMGITKKFLEISNLKLIEGIDEWSAKKEHSISWEDDELRAKTKVRIKKLFKQNGFKHFHVYGNSGVGKTRLALEVCKEAELKNRVLYSWDFYYTNSDILKSINDFKSNIVLVVDGLNEKNHLTSLIKMCEERKNIKLLTVGTAELENSEHSELSKIKTLKENNIKNIVKKIYPYFNDDVSFNVARLSGGYVRLAILVALCIDKARRDGKGLVTVRELLSENDIKQFIKNLFNKENLELLHACSLLTSLGFEGGLRQEAEIITNHLGIKWEKFLRGIKLLTEEEHIIQEVGRYRHISPELLGIYIAVDAWGTYGVECIFSLIGKFSPDTLHRFFNRLKQIAHISPNVVKKQIFRFQKIDDFLPEINCKIWSALSYADPQSAVSVLKTALSKASIEEKRQIKDEARGWLVSTLSHYADFEDLLLWEDSMLALAELAMAENASWANNATGEFRNKFQFFGQPREQYSKYFLLLKNILEKNNDDYINDDYIKIVILALDSSIATMVNRNSPAKIPGTFAWENGQLEPDESPVTRDYLLFALEKINEFLPSIINRINNNNNDLDLKTPFLSLLSHVAYLFRYKTLRTAGERIFESISPLKETMREDIRQTLFTSEEWIRKFGNATAEEIDWIKNLHSQFKDTSIKGRLREAVVDYIGYSVNEDTPEAIKKIAQEVFADNDLQTLKEEWAWLTSREAQQVGYLGAELARLDEKNLLSEHLPKFSNRGENWLLLLNYYREKNSLLGDQWLNDWMLKYEKQNPEDRRLPLAVAMYGQGSDDKARFVMRSLSQGIEPQNFPWLATIVGFWSKGLSYEVAKLFIELLANKNKYRAIALEFLFYRLRHFSGEESSLPTPAEDEKESILDYQDIALSLVTDVKILRQEYEQRSGMIVYEWQEVSEMLIKKSPKCVNKIVDTVFSACLPEFVKGKSSYTDDLLPFHSRDLVAKVLMTCAEKDKHLIWQYFVPYLESKDYRLNVFYTASFYKFHGIFNHYLNSDTVINWINNDIAKKNKRIELIAELVKNNFNYDSGLQNNALNECCLIARMLEAYPDSEYLFRIFFTNLTCGVHSGATSSKIQKVIDELRKIKQTTKNVAVNAFIDKSLPNLEDRKKREEEREKEERLLYGF